MDKSVTSLPVLPLTQENFAPFGEVIEAVGDYRLINDGTTQRFHDLACLDLVASHGRPMVSIFRAQPRPRPIEIKLLERHPLSSQAFIPLGAKPFLIVVAPCGETVEVDAIRAFISNGQQGVNYHRNIWHHPLLAIDETMDFIVIDRDGPEVNCDEYFFNKSNRIIISSFHALHENEL